MVCAVGAARPLDALCVGCVSRVDGVDTDIKPARRERRARPAERAEDLAVDPSQIIWRLLDHSGSLTRIRVEERPNDALQRL